MTQEKNIKFLLGYINPVISKPVEGGRTESAEDIRVVEKNLELAKDIVEKEGLSCEVHQTVRGFSPGEDIVKFAKETNIDQIYVGVKKRSRLSKILLGSNAQYIILRAHCPVITVNVDTE